jgi:hypothetical protein
VSDERNVNPPANDATTGTRPRFPKTVITSALDTLIRQTAPGTFGFSTVAVTVVSRPSCTGTSGNASEK